MIPAGVFNTTRSGAKVFWFFFSKKNVLLFSSGLPLSSDSDLLVSVQVAGHGGVEQDGRTAALQRGDFTLYDGTRPYKLRFAGAEAGKWVGCASWRTLVFGPGLPES